MTPQHTADDIHTPIQARVSVLEKSVVDLHEDFSDVKKALADIQEVMRTGGRTNWTVIFAGIALLLAVWAAAIRPLAQDIDRIDEGTKSTLLITKDLTSQVNTQQVQIQINSSSFINIQKQLDDIHAHGSPITDRRLALIEQKMNMPIQSNN
jgi:hypothetical protein